MRAETINLEVACFKGAYGIDFYEKCAREFEKLHPGVKINVWGSPRVWDQLIPRFASNTAPDIVYPGWGMNVFSLIFDNQLHPLDKYLNQPALNSDRKWLDTFLPNMIKKGTYKGHYYTLPFNFDTTGWWYNRKMFREHGWKVPRNYDELLAVCEEIKKTEIAPVTFTGRYPQYMLDGFFFPWAYRLGGQAVLDRIDKLEPGAWNDPACLKAAQTFMDMKKRGNFQPGCIGMNHTESQMEFLVGRAAMIPNGTWLYTEMKNLLPPGFEMEFMRAPNFREGIGDPTAMPSSWDGKGWCIAANSKHPDMAAEYLRYLTSTDTAARFLVEKGTLMAILNLPEGDVPDHLREPMKAVRNAKSNWAVYYGQWYPELGTAVQNGIRALYNEVHTPEQFCDKMESIAEKMRRDPHLRKFSSDK